MSFTQDILRKIKRNRKRKKKGTKIGGKQTFPEYGKEIRQTVDVRKKKLQESLEF